MIIQFNGFSADAVYWSKVLRTLRNKGELEEYGIKKLLASDWNGISGIEIDDDKLMMLYLKYPR